MTGIIILAAGASTRLGAPKQSLQFKGKTLLQIAIVAAVNSECKPVILVTGSNAEAILIEADISGVSVVHNADWVHGMASSIRKGINELQKLVPGIDAAIVLLCDQPFVDAALLKNLLQHKIETGKKIVACSYNGMVGVPVLFDKTFFEDLLLLEGEQGAKKILLQHKDEVFAVNFPKGAIDIDTQADYTALINS